ncbi:cell envelope integrity protein TolA [Pseudoxanthomonas sp. CF125]|uniref:cell envelope integrity protein TolA n=1 Tax=Pseudoxanthomonas sp. CF125 TaxID=1855303 RepID=UPI00088EFE69|nr:cell envelope integrity protein TolA [Pseudoxanthomonas sp. CF125]SDQ92326.1 colicin import membrane protein [Pseudoxanthomonas sp. CF125]
MHADVAPRGAVLPEESYGKAIAYAVGLHLLLAVLLWLSSWLTWDHDSASAAGLPVMEASLDASAADIRAAERALQHVPEPLPQPVEETAEEETVPPPQPIEEPRPQDSPTPQQQVAQERIPVPDSQDQDEASRLALSQEKALQEQEQKRRQEQIDLTEQKRVEEAQKQQRLAKQQEEAEKQKKLDEIRRLRTQAAKDAQLAEQKLRQLADARARQTTAPAAATGTSAPAGNNGVDDGLLAKYIAAIQQQVSGQWTRPESVPLGTKCRVVIKQLPGGQVMSAEVQPGCAMDQAGQDSLERAVLKSQPLPYRGFESVFNRTLNFNFTAQDR